MDDMDAAAPHTVTGQAAQPPATSTDSEARDVRLAVLHRLEHGESSVEEAMTLLARAR